MRTSYLVSRHEGTWGLYLWEDDITILQSGLPNETTAFEQAIGHARATTSSNFRILEAEEDGKLRIIYDSEE